MSDAFLLKLPVNLFVLRSFERGRDFRRIRVVMDERESANLVGFAVDRSRLELPMDARCALIRMQASLIAHHHVVTVNFPDAILGFNIFLAFETGNLESTISLECKFPIYTIS